MANLMSDTEIEAAVTQAHADLLAELIETTNEKQCDAAMVRCIRAAFTLGLDQGKATVFASIESVLGEQIDNARGAQLARSVATIRAWCLLGMYAGQRNYTIVPECWAQACLGVQCARVRMYSAAMADDRSFEGSDENEALAKAATWCEHEMVVATSRDIETPTEPNNEIPQRDGGDAEQAIESV